MCEVETNLWSIKMRRLKSSIQILTEVKRERERRNIKKNFLNAKWQTEKKKSQRMECYTTH